MFGIKWKHQYYTMSYLCRGCGDAFCKCTPSVGDSVVDSVIRKFAQRSRVGQEKYGTTLDRTDLKTLDWIIHAQEELMDGILYLEKLKQSFR